MKGRLPGTEAGFTLAEMLVATTIVAIGFVAVAAAFQYALSGIEAGRGETTATFLAEHKLEELKAIALVDWTHSALSAATTIEYCPPTGGHCTATATAGSYRRATTVTDDAGQTCTTSCKVVHVSVFYRPVTGLGQLDQERRIDLFTIFASRT